MPCLREARLLFHACNTEVRRAAGKRTIDDKGDEMFRKYFVKKTNAPCCFASDFVKVLGAGGTPCGIRCVGYRWRRLRSPSALRSVSQTPAEVERISARASFTRSSFALTKSGCVTGTGSVEVLAPNTRRLYWKGTSTFFEVVSIAGSRWRRRSCRSCRRSGGNVGRGASRSSVRKAFAVQVPQYHVAITSRESARCWKGVHYFWKFNAT